MGEKAISVDEQFLKDLGNNSFYANQTGIKQALSETADEALAKQQQDADKLTKTEERAQQREDRRLARLQARAEHEGIANQKRLDREQEKTDEERATRLNQKQRQRQSTLQNTVESTQRSVSGGIGTLADRVGSLQTVGGIGLLLVILAVLVFAIVQVNSSGDTRLKQFWYMLNGRATLQGAVEPSGVIGGGAAGSFQSAPTPGAVGGFANPPAATTSYRTSF